jgi:hypothetical protein
MFQPLDIFKTDSEDGVLWRSAAEDFAAAKRCIEKLALSSPGEYLILDQQTGRRQRMMVISKDDSIQALLPARTPVTTRNPRKTSISS